MIGNGMPHAAPDRLIEKSSRPPRMNPSISLRRKSGWTKSGMLLEVPLEPFLVGRQPEEPVVLGEPLQRRPSGGSGSGFPRRSRCTSDGALKPSAGQYQPS